MKRSNNSDTRRMGATGTAASAGTLLAMASLLGASLGVKAAGTVSYPPEHGDQAAQQTQAGQAKTTSGAWLSNQNKASGLRSDQYKLQSNQNKASHQLKRSASQLREGPR